MSRESIYKRYRPELVENDVSANDAYWFAFAPGGMLLQSSGDRLSIPLLANLDQIGIVPVRRQYMGVLEGRPCYSAELPSGCSVPAGMVLKDLRFLYGAVDEDLFLLAGRAQQIVAWDQTHQYCGRCGEPTQYLPGERARKCPRCGLVGYPRLSPAVITAVIKDDSILLARYAAFRGKMHTIIAGFVEPGETLEECLRREVFEEVGVNVKNIKYHGSQPWPFPNSLMIGFTAEWESGDIRPDGQEIAEAGWFDAAHLPDLPPKMSIAREIIDWFAAGGRP